MKLRARREEDKVRREAAILNAGREVWSHKPPNEFTMSAVAERAGVVRGTIYLYFPTKEDLLEAVSDRMLGETLRSTRASADSIVATLPSSSALPSPSSPASARRTPSSARA